MARIDKSIEVNVPIDTVYNQWTQFEEFPRFMQGIRKVRQLDDKNLEWEAEIGGKEEHWKAEITAQVPNSHIAWRSTSGAEHAGRVAFEPLGADHTRVHLVLDYEPRGAAEKIGSALGVLNGRVDRDLKAFKEFIETRRRETGAWRGEIKGGQVTRESEPSRRMDAPGASGPGGASTQHRAGASEPQRPGTEPRQRPSGPGPGRMM